MNAQDIFDKVVKHLRKQDGKALINGLCAYRGDGGRKCAFGVLIPDKLYDKKFEGKLIWGVFHLSPELQNKYSEHAGLIAELQRVHDMESVLNWEKHFKRIAEGYGLKYTEKLARRKLTAAEKKALGL